jgi:hypothetical protein
VKVDHDIKMEDPDIIHAQTSPARTQIPDAIEVIDSDAEMEDRSSSKPAPTTGDDSPTPPNSNFVYHTNNHLATRQTSRSWHGSHRPDNWIVSREELHADEVDCARELPVTLEEGDFPVFVSNNVSSFE